MVVVFLFYLQTPIRIVFFLLVVLAEIGRRKEEEITRQVKLLRLNFITMKVHHYVLKGEDLPEQ